MSDLLRFTPQKHLAVSAAEAYEVLSGRLFDLPRTGTQGDIIRGCAASLSEPFLLELAQLSHWHLSNYRNLCSQWRVHQAVLILERVDRCLLSGIAGRQGLSGKLSSCDLFDFAHRALRGAYAQRDEFAAILLKLVLCKICSGEESMKRSAPLGFAEVFRELDGFLNKDLFESRRRSTVVDLYTLSGGDRLLARDICLATCLPSALTFFKLLIENDQDAVLFGWQKWLKEKLTPEICGRFAGEPWLEGLRKLNELLESGEPVPSDVFVYGQKAILRDEDRLARLLIEAVRQIAEDARELTNLGKFESAEAILCPMMSRLHQEVVKREPPAPAVVEQFFACAVQRIENLKALADRHGLNASALRENHLHRKAYAIWQIAMKLFGLHGSCVGKPMHDKLLATHLSLPEHWK